MATTDPSKREKSDKVEPHERLSCDGQGLKRLTSAGMMWLERNYDTVNALNVFPVPDGDTGINMLLTMRNAWDEIVHATEENVGVIAADIAKGAVMGSRGNSGVILSQLWLGFASALEGTAAFDAPLAAQALRRASEFADNVRGMKPVEGTILTVARDGASAAENAVKESNDLRVCLEQVVAEMHRSVERTPELLVKNGVYVLKEAGVVDAGGLGLAYILEGMLKYLQGEPIEMSAQGTVAEAQKARTIDLSGLDYPYDVQFLLSGDQLDIEAVSGEIESMGDSALVVGDTNTIKVHVHVENPGVPLSYAVGLGTLSDVVVENMREQYQDYLSDRTQSVAPAYEVQPPDVKPGEVGVITVAPGKGLERIFYSLGAARVVSGGQTMNPSTEELVEAVAELPTDKIVLLPNNKNIIMAAEQAVEHAPDKDVRVVKSRTIPQGISALLSLDPLGDLDEVVAAMQATLDEVETGEITTATRTTSVNGISVKEGQFIGLHNDDLTVADNSIETTVMNLLDKMQVGQKELVTLYYGNGVSEPEASALVETLTQQYPSLEFEIADGGQPHYYYILSAE